ncbi:hypothetical protein GCM10027425_12400 [Alteromonas gracilis]
MTATHVGAILVESIPCPSWCTVSQEEHLQDLPDWEGSAIHQSESETIGDITIKVTSMTYADGQPDRTEGAFVWVAEQEFDPDAAERLAHAILAAAKRVRG